MTFELILAGMIVEEERTEKKAQKHLIDLEDHKNKKEDLFYHDDFEDPKSWFYFNHP